MEHQDRILIVDDNPINVEILEEALLDEGYYLETAASGEEALEIVPDFNPALILLDVMMPGIDGYETCRRIRANPSLRHTKIILVSAKAMVSERLQGYEAGADDYICKPFDIEEFLAKVRVHLRLKSIEEVDQLKSDLLSLLNHETGTPLNSIIPPIEMLMSDEDMDAGERKMWLNIVHKGAKRLHSLFKKVTTLSAMKSGKWDFQLATVDLCEVVHNSLCEVASQASEQNVQIEQKLPEAAITRLDPEQMNDVVTAILDNAIRFSPSNGRVMVDVSRDGDHHCVLVADQGVGIDPDFLPHVFEEFANVNIRHHTEGQGLSLAIARQIVLAHNGTIGVESTKGAGTTFTVQLPAAAPSDGRRETLP